MSRNYMYCIVPLCSNTTITAPEKIFFDVPRNVVERNIWCHAMKQDEKKNPVLSSRSARNICQDHFDLETDTENYLQHKLQGAKLRLKKGTLPHKFACQKNKSPAPVPSTSTERAAKTQRKRTVEDLLNNYEPSTSEISMTELSLTSNADEEVITVDDITSYFDKACQVNLKAAYRSKSTNTTSVITSDVGCTALSEMKDKACSSGLIVQEYAEECTFSDAEEADTDYVCENTSGSDYEPEDDNDEEKRFMRACMIKSALKNSLMCLGIQDEEKFLIEILSSKSNCPTLNIMITLKKIRQNETYEYLGMLFGMSTSNVSRIFKETLFYLAGTLQNFIVWPSDPNSIKLSLPVAFRKSYHNVQSIIDCFEIPIEKPSDAFQQTLTWSEYYKDNTIKYLVSCTPDGTVSFISSWVGVQSLLPKFHFKGLRWTCY